MKQVPPRYGIYAATILVITLLGLVFAVFWIGDTEDLDRLVARARLALERNEVAEAAELLDRVLARQPAHGAALLLRGQVWYSIGDSEQALADWLQVPDTPSDVAATSRYLAGSLLLEQDRAREAALQLREAARVAPSFLDPQEHLLKLYVLQRRRMEARGLLDEIRRHRPLSLEELVLYIDAGEPIIPAESAVPRLRNFVQRDPEDMVSLYALAQYYIEQSQWSPAEELLASARVRHPADAQLRGLLAQVLRGASRPAAAASLVADPRPADPEAEAWWWWRSAADVAEDEGNIERAVACFEQLVRLDPDDPESRYRLGLLLQETGREAEGKAHLESSVWMDRLQQQASVAVRVDRGQVEILLPVVLQVGKLLSRLERHMEASQWFQVAVSLRPDDESAQQGLAAARQGLEAESHGALSARGDEMPEARQATQPLATTGSAPTREPPPKSHSPSETAADAPLRLRDVHRQAGLDHQYFNGETGYKYLLESMGGGVAVLDYDGDGWPDLYFPQGCRLPYNPNDTTHRDRLFRNRGDGTFEDVTERAGLGDNRYGQGCVAGDLDNDGHVDLVVANYGRNSVYLNNGDGTFRDATQAWGLEAEEMSSSLALADLDLDGHLDLYVVNYVDSLKVCRDSRGLISTCDPQNFGAQQDRLYLNSGEGGFVEVTTESGVVAPDGKGLGVVIADFDDDGWPDIYVANDGTPNFLFHNRTGASTIDQANSEPAKSSTARSGPEPDAAGRAPVQFRERGLVSGTAMSGDGRAEAGMGIACADLNGDLLRDLFVTNYFQETNTLYVNRGGMAFSDGTRAARLTQPSEPMLGFGTQAIDLNRNGWPDLFVANGHIDDFEYRGEPWKMAPQVFRNLGRGVFEEVSPTAAGDYFAGRYLGRGVARLDFNRDGRPDLVVVHQDAPTALLLNETPGGHGVVLHLRGTTANRDAIGARVHVRTPQREQVIEICGGDGYYASNERRQFVGLGGEDQIDELEVHWPGGDIDVWADLPVDCELLVVQGCPPTVRMLPYGGM